MYDLKTERKNYVTKAGYVVTINNREGNPDLCPGINNSGRTIKEHNERFKTKNGWSWRSDGTISGLQHPWNDDLEIIGEYALPFGLPSGYKWKGDFPKLDVVKEGDIYLDIFGHINSAYGITDQPVIGTKRIILQKVPAEKVDEQKVDLTNSAGKYYVTEDGYVIKMAKNALSELEYSPGVNKSGSNKAWSWCNDGTIYGLTPEWNQKLRIIGECPKELIPTLPKGYRYKGGYPKFESLQNGDIYLSKTENKANTYENDYIGSSELVGRKRILLEKVNSIELKSGWYITQSGYAVELDEKFHGKVGEITYIWNSDGTFQNKSFNDMDIIGECPKELIPKLPDGYRWVGDHPKFVKPENGQTILSNSGKPLLHRNTNYSPFGVAEGRRILIEKVPSEPNVPLEVGKIYLTKGGWLVKIASISEGVVNFAKETSPGKINMSDDLEIVSEYTEKLNPEFPQPPAGYKWKHGFPKLTEVANDEPYVNEYASNFVANSCGSGSYKEFLCLVPAEPAKDLFISKEAAEEIKAWSSGGEVYSLAFAKDARWDIMSRSMDLLTSSFYNKKKEEEVMKKETAIAASKAVGSFAWKTANYWIFEPATAWGKKAMSSVRHVTFAGLLFGSFCMWMNPQKTMTIVKSCIPKISVSVEAPDIVK